MLPRVLSCVATSVKCWCVSTSSRPCPASVQLCLNPQSFQCLLVSPTSAHSHLSPLQGQAVGATDYSQYTAPATSAGPGTPGGYGSAGMGSGGSGSLGGVARPRSPGSPKPVTRPRWNSTPAAAAAQARKTGSPAPSQVSLKTQTLWPRPLQRQSACIPYVLHPMAASTFAGMVYTRLHPQRRREYNTHWPPGRKQTAV